MNDAVWNLFLDPSMQGKGLRRSPGAPGSDAPPGAVILDGTADTRTAAGLEKAVRQAGSVLGPEGRLVIPFDNPLSFRRCFGIMRRQGGPGFSLKELQRVLRRNGFGNSLVFNASPGIVHRSVLTIQGGPGEPAAWSGLKGGLKELVLASAVMKHFQESYVAVAARSAPVTTLLQDIVRRVSAEPIGRIIIGSPYTLIVLLRTQVVRIPLERLSEQRCRVQGRVLRALARTPFAGLAPRLERKDVYGSYTMYTENRLPGVSIDRPVRCLDELLRRAAAFLCDFHRWTARETAVTETVFRRLFARDLRRLKTLVHPAHGRQIDGIEGALRTKLRGKRFVTVWMHGDFKLENILWDLHRRRITGVIDWDFSRRQGLPLLDLWYLLFYGAALREGTSITEQFVEKLAAHRYSDGEREMMRHYREAVGVRPEFTAPLLVMFWVHHFVHRHRLQLLDPSPGARDAAGAEIRAGLAAIGETLR